MRAASRRRRRALHAMTHSMLAAALLSKRRRIKYDLERIKAGSYLHQKRTTPESTWKRTEKPQKVSLPEPKQDIYNSFIFKGLFCRENADQTQLIWKLGQKS
ncbi:hypothetical protein AMECASPLE_017974 [Ameca splendens]|uniref:Uncharacterized protein n=1 Tax=Ameca splendens TaxID=208324 RepID=A0ABV0YQX2_9TELE